MKQPDEPLNVYDAEGRVIGVAPRREAKASGSAVGVVTVLLVNARGEVLLQRRPPDKENGGRWDKSVGGHVGAGEEFDDAVVRETGEELFDDPRTPQVLLAPSPEELRVRIRGLDLGRQVLLYPAGLQRNLRDVRLAPGGAGVRNVLYHVGIYLGRTDVPIESFRPQAAEIEELRWVAPAGVDALLASGRLAPNMAFLWLTRARELLGLAAL